MKCISLGRILTVLLMVTGIAACAPQSSAERHARQYANVLANSNFDPNFVINKTDTTQGVMAWLKDYHEKGAKDKASGLSRVAAQQNASQFRSDNYVKSLNLTNTSNGKEFAGIADSNPKVLKAMGEAIAATYMDGYEGKN